MKKTLILLFILGAIGLKAQNKYTKVWDNYLNNNRKDALKQIQKKDWSKLDVEGLLLRQMILISSGNLNYQEEFHQNFVKQPDYPYYLFAVLNDGFIMDNYLDNGLPKDTKRNILFYYQQNIKQPESMGLIMDNLYATLKLYQRNAKESNEILDKINVVRDWEYCGVFENLNKSGISIPYPPEKKAYSKEDFNANSNGKVNWYQPDFNLSDIYYYFFNHIEYGSGINYAQSFVKSPEDQEVYIHLTIGKAAKLWLNDVLIFEQTEDRTSQLDAYTIKVKLPRGNNRILYKTTNEYKSFFVVRITDKEGNKIPGLTYSKEYSPYNHSTAEQINPELQKNVYEEFFKDKIKKNPDNVFYQIMLVKTYIANSKDQLAEKLLNKLLEKYPKSTYLRGLQKEVYSIQEKYDKITDINKNIQNDDPDSFVAIFSKLADTQDLMRKDLDEMNAFLDKVRKSTDYPLAGYLCDIITYAREGDNVKLKKVVDEMINMMMEEENYSAAIMYASIRTQIFKEEEKEIELLQKILKKYYNVYAYNSLIDIYAKHNQNDKILELYKEMLDNYPDQIDLYKKIVDKLMVLQRYKEAMPYVDKALHYFPYSFELMEYKGKIYQQLGEKKKAIKWYKKSLSHNSGNSSLRKRINDLLKVTDPFKTYVPDEAYDYIKKNRTEQAGKDYDITILLDEMNFELFEEGGYRYRGTYIYKVNSQKGIDMLKEYNLNLSGDYRIKKAEIVKPDGSIVPADKAGSSFVFKDLAIGDVVYMDFDVIITKTGRFYKDITDSSLIESIHPIIKTVYRVFVPKNINLFTKELNGKIGYTKKNKGKYTIYEWKKENLKPLPPHENYMPENIDVYKAVVISTLDSWEKIANWYKDLSRASIKYDNVVDETFDKIFPKGYKHLSEDERAKRIYDFIEENITYSYVDFRQSGKIPQKPSKVLDTKLGDCKDLSTLFLTLGRKAELQVNLVLVKTNGYGRNSLVLPSTAFNHAIARVVIDGEVQYLELTDKYLPYKALPESLLGACALDIPYDENDKLMHKGLIHLDNLKQTKTVLQTDVVYDIYDDKQEVKIRVTGTGRANSKLNSLLDEKNEEVLKKEITKYFEKFDKLDLDLISYNIIQHDTKKPKTIFEAKFHIKNKLQSFGNSTIFKLPLQLNPYTTDLVNLDKRAYPIFYAYYEYVDEYISHYTVNLKDGGKFIEIPENIDLTFKEHHYSQKFSVDDKGALHVDIDVHTPIKNISAEEYPEFKKYVKEALKAMELLTGFKK